MMRRARCSKIASHTPTYYQFGAYQLQIELLRGLFPDGERTNRPRLKDESAQAWTLNELANSYSLSGQPARAVPLFEAQNRHREKQGDKENLAIGLGNLADDQIKIGALAAAEANLRRQHRPVPGDRGRVLGGGRPPGAGPAAGLPGRVGEAERELDAALGLFEKQTGRAVAGCRLGLPRPGRAAAGTGAGPHPIPPPSGRGRGRGGGLDSPAERWSWRMNGSSRSAVPTLATTSAPTGCWARRWPRMVISMAPTAT